MTRYLGFVTRPFVSWYGDQEVIACGLRADDQSVRIIYTPKYELEEPWFVKRMNRAWKTARFESTKNYSGTLVRQTLLPDAQLDEVYRVRARRKDRSRVLRSPSITVKKESPFDPNLIQVEYLQNGEAKFSWKAAEKYEIMIYFFTLEDDQGGSLAGVYTRENTWVYPRLKKASYSVGPTDPPPLEKGRSYTAKLVVVDFDGWVSGQGSLAFE